MKYDKFSKLDLLISITIFFYPLISEFISIKYANNATPYVISHSLHLGFLTSLTLLLVRTLFFLFFLAPSIAYVFGIIIVAPSFYYRIVDPTHYLGFVESSSVLKNICAMGLIYVISTFIKDKCIFKSREILKETL